MDNKSQCFYVVSSYSKEKREVRWFTSFSHSGVVATCSDLDNEKVMRTGLKWAKKVRDMAALSHPYKEWTVVQVHPDGRKEPVR